jgi:hypothetical protein
MGTFVKHSIDPFAAVFGRKIAGHGLDAELGEGVAAALVEVAEMKPRNQTETRPDFRPLRLSVIAATYERRRDQQA